MEFLKANVIPGEVLVQLIAFLVLFWILKRFAWKPLLNALESRRERIQEQFDQIEKSKKEIEALRENYTTHLQNIDEDSRTKIREAIEKGHRIAKEIQDNATITSQKNFEKAKKDIELEIEKASITLRNEIADLAIRVSEKVVREKMTGEKQQEKILEILEELEKKP